MPPKQLQKRSVFFSILREAGKPASLHMTRFDLPEAYGIVDPNFRTEKMAHVRRYRLSSASRAAKRAPTDPLSEPPASSPPQQVVVSTAPLDTSNARGTDASATTIRVSSTLPASIASPVRTVVGDDSHVAEEEHQSCPPSASPVAESAFASFIAQQADESFSLQATLPREDYQVVVVEAPGDCTTNDAHIGGVSALTVVASPSRRDRNPLAVTTVAPYVLQDCPDTPQQILEAHIAAIPLTVTNLIVYRPEPKDERTGTSKLRDLHQQLTSMWVKSVLWLRAHHSTALVPDELRQVSLPSRVARPLPTGQSGNAQCPASPKIVRHVASSNARSVAGATGRSPLSQRLDEHNSEQLSGSQEERKSPFPLRGSSRSTSLNSSAQLFSRDPAHHTADGALPDQAAAFTFHSPLAHLPLTDILGGLLQATHFHPEQYPQKSLLNFTANAEADMIASRGVASRASTTGLAAGSASTAATAATTLRESAADPTFFVQRFMSTQLSLQELEILRGEMAMQRSMLGDPATLATSTRRAGQNGASAAPEGGSHSTMFGVGVKGILGRLLPPPGERRFQWKCGGAPSRCHTYPFQASGESNAPTPHSGRSVTTGAQFPPQLLSLPGCSGKKSMCKWNAAFQHLTNELAHAASCVTVVRAHEELRNLNRSFVEACAAFVEDNLPSLVESIQIVHDGILFSLMTRKVSSSRSSVRPSSGGTAVSATQRDEDDRGSDDEGVSKSGERDALTSETIHRSSMEHEATLGDDDDTNSEAATKISSAQVRMLSMCAKHWFRASHPPVHQSALFNEENTPLIAPHSTLMSDDVFQTLLRENSLGKGATLRETYFPLTCAVHYLGLVIMCTARVPADVETSAAPVSKVPRYSALLSAVGDAMGTSPYCDRTPDSNLGGGGNFDVGDTSGSPLRAHTRRIETSRHVVMGEVSNVESTDGAGTPNRVQYLLAVPTITPPLIPTMQYSKWLRLRPEFTRVLTDELPCDTFSASATPSVFAEKAAAQATALKVARKLLHKTVSDLVRCWETSTEPLRSAELCEAMHRRGVNMTLLGYIADLLHTKVKSLRGGGANATRPSSPTQEDSAATSGPLDDGNDEDQDASGKKKLDALSKALATVKLEMAVRAFRWHWNTVMRDRVLLAGVDPLPALRSKTTEMIKHFLGNESDPMVSLFWSRVITPRVRSHFHLRAPLGRKDLSLQQTLMRVEALCGIVTSPGTAKDALNAVMLHKHEDLLSLELRNTRAIAIGSVIELRPYVKATAVPYLPPLSRCSDGTDPKRCQEALRYLERAETALTQLSGPIAEETLAIRKQRLEVLFLLGEHHYEAMESILIHSLVKLQQEMVPLYHEAVEFCLYLSRLYLAGHRNLDAIRSAEDAISVSLAIPQSARQRNISFLFATLFAGAKECGNRELAIHSMERLIASTAKRLEWMTRDPFHVGSTWCSARRKRNPLQRDGDTATETAADDRGGSTAGAGDSTLLARSDSGRQRGSSSVAGAFRPLCPLRRQVLLEQSVLYNAIQHLVDAYKAISYHTLEAPLSVHETVANPFMVQFLYELGCAKAGTPCEGVMQLPGWSTVDIVAAKSIFSRVLHITEILSLRADPLQESAAVAHCRRNLAQFRDL